MDRYPFYYEVKAQNTDEPEMIEGGFLYATDHMDAMRQLSELYEPGLVSVSIEYLNNATLFAFPIEKARQAREWVEKNAAY